MGTSINIAGDIMIAYGSYNGYIAAYTKAYGETRWRRYVCLASDEGHSMMYNYAVIINPQKFYILAIQDWSSNNEIYYQYAKLYTFDGEKLSSSYADENPMSYNEYPDYSSVASSNGWTQTMVIDKRGAEKTNAVRTEDCIYIDDTLHIVVRDSVKNNLLHYTYKNEELVLQKDNFSAFTRMVRIVKNNEKLYYITYETLFSKIKIIEIESEKLVYRKFNGFDINNDGNIYVDRFNQEHINILFIKKAGDINLYSLNSK